MTVELKNLFLSRSLAVIDLESTGLDPDADRIVEIAILILSPSHSGKLLHTLVNPGRPIPASATIVHGISDVDVLDSPHFRDIARGLARQLDGCDFAGFGISTFDLPLLACEFARCEVQFRLSSRSVLDALTVFRRQEPRSLAAAVDLYLGRQHSGAHSAVHDVTAAIEVLDEQVRRYALPVLPAVLHAALVEVDVAGKFRRSEAGIMFGFGKYAGRLLSDIATSDPHYLEWMLTRPFLDDVHTLVRAALAANTQR